MCESTFKHTSSPLKSFMATSASRLRKEEPLLELEEVDRAKGSMSDACSASSAIPNMLVI